MASSAHLCFFTPTGKSGRRTCKEISRIYHKDLNARHNPVHADKFQIIKAKAAKDDGKVKPKSVICTDCDGNGAVLCSQCKGKGVNKEDMFNGQFKAGDSCWLCGGRKEMLCGNCNGAGFIGGFMSTFDE